MYGCKKNKKLDKIKNRERERERERERGREVTFFVWKKCVEWKEKCQIYSKMMRIRRVKIKEDKRIENEWY